MTQPIAVLPSGRPVGLEVTCVASGAHKGSSDRILTRFHQLGGPDVVTKLLAEAGFNPTARRHRVTVVNQFTRTTAYPVVSNVMVDDPAGVQFRFKPDRDNPEHLGFVCRLIAEPTPGVTKELVAVRLRLAAERLYGKPKAEPPPPAVPPATVGDLDRALDAVKTLLGYKFQSDDPVAWGKAVAEEIGPVELGSKWRNVLTALTATGRIVWSDGGGYTLQPPPATTPTPPILQPVLAAPMPPPPLPPAAVITPPSAAADLSGDLAELMAKFAKFQDGYTSASSVVTEAEWEVRQTGATLDAARAAVAAAEAAAAAARGKLAAAKAARALTAQEINPEILLTMAAQLEAVRRPAAAGPKGGPA